ncbi:MAG: DUF1595 domain-containing protein, partial [Myxococcota bacterium]
MTGASARQEGGQPCAGSSTWGWLAAALLVIPGCYTGTSGSGPGAGADGGPGDGADGADGADDGGDDGDDGDDGSASACGDGIPTVASRPMRRLTPAQYQNTMRDLLGDESFVAEYDDLELVPTERGIRQLRGGAELAVTNIDQWSSGLVACDIHGAEDAACPGDVIDTFAPLAFRRPLTEDERTWLHNVYDEAREDEDFEAGMEALLGTILQAPAFVYLAEQGAAVEGGPDEIRRLDDYEMASRLSYFLWDSMPDEALF